DGGLLGGFHHDRIAGDEGGGGHAAQDGKREIPRRDNDGDAARLVEIAVLFTGYIATARRSEPQHLAAIELAVIDALGDIGIGLAPRLAALVDLPSRQLETSPPHHLR